MTLALVPAADVHAAPRRPLVTVRAAPRREPPFDDELAPDTAASVSVFDQPLPFEQTAPEPPPPVHRPLDEGLPEPSQWARRLLVGLVEAAAGKRPLHQLAPLLTPSIADGLSTELARAEVHGRRHWLHGTVPRTVRAMQPCAGVAEVNATVRVGERVRAIALRVERRHDRWRCTRIQLG